MAWKAVSIGLQVLNEPLSVYIVRALIKLIVAGVHLKLIENLLPVEHAWGVQPSHPSRNRQLPEVCSLDLCQKDGLRRHNMGQKCTYPCL